MKCAELDANKELNEVRRIRWEQETELSTQYLMGTRDWMRYLKNLKVI